MNGRKNTKARALLAMGLLEAYRFDTSKVVIALSGRLGSGTCLPATLIAEGVLSGHLGF